MDADLSHDPKYLPDLVAGLDRHDLVIGSRYLRGISVVNWPLHRIALSAFANRYIRTVTGVYVTDCTGAYRVWRRDALARLPLVNARANGYAFLTEMLYEASRMGLRIGEAPIVFVERQEGYSKVSTPVLLESLLTPWRLLFRGGRVSDPPSDEATGQEAMGQVQHREGASVASDLSVRNVGVGPHAAKRSGP